MYSSAVTSLFPRWNRCIGQLSSLYRIQCTFPFWTPTGRTADCNSQVSARCTNWQIVREGSYSITSHGCLRKPQKLLPHMSNSNCFCSRMSSFVNLFVALTQTFRSLGRWYYSFLNAIHARFHYFTGENDQFDHAARSTSGSLPEYSSHGMLCVQRSDCSTWCVKTHSLLCYLPAPYADNSLVHFHIMQQRFKVTGSTKSNIRSPSQKPDNDSRQKPTAIQLNNVQQLMTDQVSHVQFLYALA